MSQNPDITDDKQRSEGDEVHKKQSNIFVNSAALIVERDIIPIYAVLKSQSQQLIWAWFWVVVTTVFCVWTISFTYAVFISDKPVSHAYDFSPERTIALVNVAAHVSVLLTSTLIGVVFDALCWALVSRSQGAALRTFLTTQGNTGLFDVSKLIFTRGTHQKWCILRFVIAAIGWVVGLLLLSHISSDNVYIVDSTFPVIAGIADVHQSILALEKAHALTTTASDTSTSQDSNINMMIVGMSKNFLTDPTFVVDVPPVNCTESDCKSVFLPGGLSLVRQLNGSALFARNSSEESVIIVNDAQGYQLEFSPTNYRFSHTDCTFYGLAFSGLFSCIAHINSTIMSGVSICPLDTMSKASCLSDTSWNLPPEVSVAMSLYRRNATVAYNKSNFSIRSIESMTDPTPATNPSLVADYQTMFKIMYPLITDIVMAIKNAIADDTILPELAYWASAYCVQSEIAAAQWLYKSSIPSSIAGPQDILEGFLAIPVQFGTLFWHFFDENGLPSNLYTNASLARASYRVRSELWPVVVFAVLTLSLVLWAIICLLYVHFKSYGKVEQEHSPTINAAFQRGNPFDVASKGFWETLSGYLGRIRGKTSSASQATAVADATDDVVARTLSNKLLIAVDRSEG